MNNKFKKIDLAKNLKIATGFSLNFSKKIIDDLLEVIINNIKIGNLNIKNVGSFKIIHKKERLGRNPKTKEEFIITSRKSVSFTPSRKIFKNLN